MGTVEYWRKNLPFFSSLWPLCSTPPTFLAHSYLILLFPFPAQQNTLFPTQLKSKLPSSDTSPPLFGCCGDRHCGAVVFVSQRGAVRPSLHSQLYNSLAFHKGSHPAKHKACPLGIDPQKTGGSSPSLLHSVWCSLPPPPPINKTTLPQQKKKSCKPRLKSPLFSFPRAAPLMSILPSPRLPLISPATLRGQTSTLTDWMAWWCYVWTGLAELIRFSVMQAGMPWWMETLISD